MMSLMDDLRESKFFGDIGMSPFEKLMLYHSDFIKQLYQYALSRYGKYDLSSSLESKVLS